MSLVEALGRPEAYPHPVDDVEVRQTHISVVALAGPYAYKVKKPVDLGFLDFTTLERRLHFCREEVRLNRRLAPDVYLGVVPLVRVDGRLRVEAVGEAVEHAVKMRRLPEDATFLFRLERGELDPGLTGELGRRIGEFHLTAESGPEIARGGRWEVVAGNARENLSQSRAHVGTSLSTPVLARLDAALEARLQAHRALIERRAAAEVPRNTHGDLHLDHVYWFPERSPPDDLVIIDCIEFNERFRYADPVADVAFLVMDLLSHDRWDLAEPLVDAYFRTTGDAEGRKLLAFYVAYRAAVRGKVGGMLTQDPEVPAGAREAAARRARGHWLLALSELEGPARRPGLVLVGGLPGTGKTTLAAELARRAGFRVISSDRVRKSLAGVEAGGSARSPFGEGIYTAEWNDRTYAACLEQAETLLFEGERVIVDASFREAARRSAFRDAARSLGVRSLFVACEAEPEVVRERLGARRGDASDADWAVYQAASLRWEPAAPEEEAWWRAVRAGVARDEAVASALHHLRSVGLAGA